MDWFVYILLCDNKSYYVGITHNLNQRLLSHKSGSNIATKEYKNIELLYNEPYKTRSEAENREKQLKGWIVAKKKALIEGDIELLKLLCKNPEVVGGVKELG